MTTMVSIGKYFLICQPPHTFRQQVDIQDANLREDVGYIFRATNFQQTEFHEMNQPDFQMAQGLLSVSF